MVNQQLKLFVKYVAQQCSRLERKEFSLEPKESKCKKESCQIGFLFVLDGELSQASS